MIVGITGAKRVGKSTVALYLDSNHGFVELSFAQRLKDMAYAVNPIVVVEQEGSSEHPLRLQQVVDELDWEDAKDQFPEVRRFLQYLGTEGVRGNFGEDAWVNMVSRDLRKIELDSLSDYSPHVVFADVRFENEAEFIRDRGGVILEIERPGYGSDDSHESENGVWADWFLINDSGEEELLRSVDHALFSLFCRRRLV